MLLLPVLHAQIPNSGFEYWSGGMPDDWCTDSPAWEDYITSIAGWSGLGVRLECDSSAAYEFETCTEYFPISENPRWFRFYYKGELGTHPWYLNHVSIFVDIYDTDLNQIGGTGEIRFDHADNTTSWTEVFLPFLYDPDPPPGRWASIRLWVEPYYPGGVAWFALDELEFVDDVNITDPHDGELWIAGETDTIRWEGGNPDMTLEIEYSDDNGHGYHHLDTIYPASLGEYEWEVPDSLLSTYMKIRLRNFTTGATLDESDRFKVKPYIITRLDDYDDYIAYNINLDRWGFGNYESDMWPYSWWFNNFDYQGIDPFTNLPYPAYGAFASAFRFEFPDWVSFVNTFTVDACYWSVSSGYYSPTAVLYWWAKREHPWGGSCFGLAISNALAFENKGDFTATYPNFPIFDHPVDVSSSDSVIPVINELFTHQYGDPHLSIFEDKKATMTPNQTLNELKETLREDDVSIKALCIYNNFGPGGHAVVPYKVEKDSSDGDRYTIWIWDNSYHDKLDAAVQIDTAWNSNNGLWYTNYAYVGWSGFAGIILTDETSSYLSKPIFPAPSGGHTAMPISDSTIEINATIDASITITDTLGNRTGYADSVITDDIPGSYPLILLNGSETPPYGYLLPTGEYSIVLEDFTADTISLFIFSGNKSYSYERLGARGDQNDRFNFGAGLSVANPDPEEKSITLQSIIAEIDHEKLFLLESLDLVQNDSLIIENIDNDENLKLISYGSEKEYGVGLEYVSESENELFGNAGVLLPANTTHTLVPTWEDLGASDLTVLVDIGNDGTIDDTLSLENETVIIEGDGQGSLHDLVRRARNHGGYAAGESRRLRFTRQEGEDAYRYRD
jgi:hypothetical protein